MIHDRILCRLERADSSVYTHTHSHTNTHTTQWEIDRPTTTRHTWPLIWQHCAAKTITHLISLLYKYCWEKCTRCNVVVAGKATVKKLQGEIIDRPLIRALCIKPLCIRHKAMLFLFSFCTTLIVTKNRVVEVSLMPSLKQRGRSIVNWSS